MDSYNISESEQQSLTGTVKSNGRTIDDSLGEKSFHGDNNKYNHKLCKRKVLYVLSSLIVLALLLTTTTLILKSTGNSEKSSNQTEPVQIYIQLNTTELPTHPLKQTTTSTTTTTTTTTTEPTDYESSGFDWTDDILTDDENILETLKTTRSSTTTATTTTTLTTTMKQPTILDDIVGKWEQVQSIGLEAYLVQEGGGWFYRKLAASVQPDLEMKLISKDKYEQVYTVPLTRKVFPMEFDAPYHHKDGLGYAVVSTASVVPDKNEIFISAVGGKAGEMTTTIKIDNQNQLWLIQTLPDKNHIKNSRVFMRKT